MQTQDENMDPVEQEFRRMRVELAHRGKETGKFRVDGREDAFNFSLTNGTRVMTLEFVNYNFNAGRHDGKDPGVRAYTPEGKKVNFLAHLNNNQIGWKSLNNRVSSRVFASEELMTFLMSPYS